MSYPKVIRIMLRHLLKYLSILTSFIPLAAQTPAESTGIEAYPAASAGLPIRKVVLLIDSKSHHEIADSTLRQKMLQDCGFAATTPKRVCDSMPCRTKGYIHLRNRSL